MPTTKSLPIFNITPVILKTFWSIYSKLEGIEILILDGTESFTGWKIGSLGGTANYVIFILV